jgi:Zn-dependent metalloprotease
MKTRALYTVLSSLICLTLLATFSTSRAQAPTSVAGEPPPPQNLVEQLRQQTGDQVRISYHVDTGQVRFIGTDLEHPMLQPDMHAIGATPEQAARQFLTTYGTLFGLGDQAQELAVMRIRTADRDRTFVRFQQVYQGIPVLGGELIVQVDENKNVVSANGEVLPGPKVDVIPTIGAEIARQRALEVVTKNHGLNTDALVATEPELWIYNPILLGGPGPRLTRLVWRMEVQPVDLLPIRELVLVDAHLGAVALHFNRIDTAKNRFVYDHNNVRGLSLPGTTPICTEGSCTGSGNDWNYAYSYAGDTYDFYSTYHSRNSIDGAGMNLVSTTRYCPADPSESCPYANAFWNGQQMAYGQGFASADDVVAHEMTHGVTDYESRLFYYMQSGAINESFSDIWGEFVDQNNGDSGTRWLMGEDLPIGAIRSMSNPPAYGDPDSMTSSQYDCGENDNGGVHGNSGVGNKAAYLLVDGGSFNGYNVTAIGMTKTSKIFYEVQTNLFTSASDYQDLYDDLQQACTNLIGTAGITVANCQEVKDAVDATRMNQQPTACPATHAPICPAGQSPNNLFFDNLENTSSGNWTKGTLSGTNVWYYPQNTHPYTGFDATYATSGQYNIWGDNPDITTDSFIRKTSDVALPAGSTLYLHFNHAYAFEDYGTSMYDGGVIEYSTDGGATWIDAGSLFTNNGYNGTVYTGYGNPLAGRQAFVAESNGYFSSRLNLSSLAGHNVRFRFRIGTDSSGGSWGWFIDDVRIYTCTGAAPSHAIYLPLVMKRWPPIPDTPVLNAISNAGGGGNYTVSWSSSSLATSYTLQEANNSSFTGAVTAYSGSSTSTSITGKAVGTYWYRVKASNSWGDSGWSNVQSVTVQPSGPSGVINGDFENGSTGWVEYSTHGADLIVTGFPGSVTPHSGIWAVWLGGLSNEVSYIQQQVTVPPGSSYLTYWHWIASQDFCGYDFGGVLINGTVVDVYTLCASTNTGGWVKHVVNLSAYAGQSVSLQIRAETDSSLNSNLFVDDVSFQASASSVQGGPTLFDPGDAVPKSESIPPRDMMEGEQATPSEFLFRRNIGQP